MFPAFPPSPIEMCRMEVMVDRQDPAIDLGGRIRGDNTNQKDGSGG